MCKKRNLLITAFLMITMIMALSSYSYAQGSVWDGSKADTSWYQGHEKETTYEISDPAQLAGFAKIVNGTADGIQQQDFSGKTVKLTSDIDMGSKSWTGIGLAADSGKGGFIEKDSKPFQGTFDGQGHEIKNIKIENNESSRGAALFGYTGSSSTLKDFTVSGSVKGVYHTAGVASVCSGSISGVVNKADITATESKLGGIISEGIGSIDISSCTNSGKITNSSKEKSTGRLGGIVGTVDSGSGGSISECSNTGDIEGYQYIGGIIGGQYGDVDISSCFNKGNLTGISFGKVYLGGISGMCGGGTISDCYNRGTLHDEHWAQGHIRAFGGITGCEEGRADGTTAITGCYNTGKMTANTSNMAEGTNYIYMAGNISGGNNSTDANTMKYENCFYLKGVLTFADVSSPSYKLWCDVFRENPKAYDTEMITAMAAEQMKDDGFPAKLGDAYRADNDSRNDGYPVLYWENGEDRAEASYDISSEVYGDDKASVSVTDKAQAGETVTLSVDNISSGRQVYKVVIRDKSGKTTDCEKNGSSWRFTMPKRQVTVIIYIEKTITGSPASHTVKLADGMDAIWSAETESGYKDIDGRIKTGATVMVTMKKDRDAATTSLDGITVSGVADKDITEYSLSKDGNGKGVTGIYAFTMPDSDVTVSNKVTDDTYEEFTVYRQTGEDGVPKPVKTYSRDDMIKLASGKTQYISGYSSDTEAFIAKAEQAVTLTAVLEDAGLTSYRTDGTTYKVTAVDGMSQTYTNNKLYGSKRYYYPEIFSGSAYGKTETDAIFTIKAYMCPQSDGDVEKKTCDTLYAYRFMFGQTEEEFNYGKPSVENKIDQYMPKHVNSLTVITDDEDITPGDGAWDGTVDVRWYNGHEDDKSYSISTPAELAGLAAIVNGKLDKDHGEVLGDFEETKSDDDKIKGNWVSVDDMDGKTITLTADLDMGGRYDKASKKWDGPNYTPIGGEWCTEVNNEETCLSTSFKGTFDGNGHTVKNIYCDRYFENKDGVEEAYKFSQSIGLIGRLGSHDKDEQDTWSDSPMVKNVTVRGYFRGRRSIGGIVGKIGKTNNGGRIENCANFATIEGTDAKGTGGIVGSSWNKGLVKNCYNAGSVKNIGTAKGFPTGGISGNNEVRVVNCYNIGKITAEYDSFAMALGTNNDAGGKFENCYWLKGTAKGGGVYPASDRDSVYVKTSSAMQKDAFLEELNGKSNAYTADSKEDPINNGYPVLKVQVNKTPSFKDLKIEGTPKTTDYTEGQAFDTTGIDVWAEYDDGSRESVEDVTVSPEKLTMDTKEVTVSCSFGGKTVSEKYSVTVVQKQLKTVEIKKAPTRITYVEGEDFDSKGMIVQAVYSGQGADEHRETVTDYTLSGDKDLEYKAGKVTVSYTYEGKTATAEQKITVLKSKPEESGGVYSLKNAEDMIWFAAQVNESEKLDIKAQLSDDIVLTGDWTPVGSQGSSFAGVFDGKGHKIEGLRLVGSKDDTYLAMFGDTENAEIKDLTVSGTVTGGSGIAGIVASARSSTKITGCTNNVTVKAYEDYAGGIAAENLDSSIIKNCRNTGKIYAGSFGGGIVGRNAGSIRNSVNKAAVTGTSDCGGIIGEQNGSGYGLWNEGGVACKDSSTGGLFGLLNTSMENKALYFAKGTADSAAGKVEDGRAATVSDWAKEQLGESFAPESLGAAYVMDMIHDIGTVTLAKESAVKAARAEYDALDADGMQLVLNSSDLTAAENKITELKNTPAAVKNLKAKVASYNSVKLTWTKTTGASGYKVYRATSKSGTYKYIGKTTSTSYTNKSLATGSTYYYKVCAYKTYNSKDIPGAYSSAASAKPVLAKTSVKLTAGKKKITVKWSKVSGATGYKIYRSPKKSSGYKCVKTVTKSSTTSYVNKSLKKGKKYYYKVRVYRKSGSKYTYSSYSSVKYTKAK